MYRSADRPRLAIVLAVFIGVKFGFLFWFAWNRRFVMDEFQQLGWAKYIPTEIFKLAIEHPKALGYAIFFDLAHLIGWNAVSILLIARMQAALLACGTLALIYAVARSLGQSKTRAALIVLILLSFSNFIERIFETRGDPLATFFAAAALLAAIRAEGSYWRIVIAGALSGLAFLSTQKAIYFDVALGLALVGDAALGRRYADGIARGAWLVAGWLLPVVIYCFVFGGGDPMAVARNLVLGPAGFAASPIAAEYGGLRQYVVQSLRQNALLYLFCIAGMILALVRIKRLDGRTRIALIFSIVIAVFVFAHDQPWPYVFVMALPFMALWSLEPIDALARQPVYLAAAWGVLGVGIAASFAKNLLYLRIDNRDQLQLVARAEALVGPSDVYFDGVGMLPNRREPSPLWLDRHAILVTMHEGKSSEAYRIFATSPPKVVLWSYRMEEIAPLVGPLIRDSYVQVAPNIRIAGARLRRGEPASFNVPLPGPYGLYDLGGKPVQGQLELGGATIQPPATLRKGKIAVTLRSGPAEALLLPEGSYAGRFRAGVDNKALFAGVYD